MELRDLSRVDLNLLISLQALLDEGSVSGAAKRLFVTQSAMSKTLGRLRELFDDPLFVRRGSGMMPTPRAQALAVQIVPVLDALQDLIQPDVFDPAQFNGEFRMLIPSYLGSWFLPGFIMRLRKQAPNARLHVVSSSANQMEELANGELDFSCQVERHTYGPGFELTPIGLGTPLLLAREGHPLQGRELDWDAVLSYPQVQLIMPEINELMFVMDENSDFVRFERNVVPQIQTDNLITALQILRDTDFLFPSPPLLLGQADFSQGVVSLPLPGEDSVRLKFVLANHERLSRSPPHQFFANLILQWVDELRHQIGLKPLRELSKTLSVTG